MIAKLSEKHNIPMFEGPHETLVFNKPNNLAGEKTTVFKPFTSLSNPVLAGCEAAGIGWAIEFSKLAELTGAGAPAGAGAGVSKDSRSTRAAGLAGSGAFTGGGWECGRG